MTVSHPPHVTQLRRADIWPCYFEQRLPRQDASGGGSRDPFFGSHIFRPLLLHNTEGHMATCRSTLHVCGTAACNTATCVALPGVTLPRVTLSHCTVSHCTVSHCTGSCVALPLRGLVCAVCVLLSWRRRYRDPLLTALCVCPQPGSGRWVSGRNFEGKKTTRTTTMVFLCETLKDFLSDAPNLRATPRVQKRNSCSQRCFHLLVKEVLVHHS